MANRIDSEIAGPRSTYRWKLLELDLSALEADPSVVELRRWLDEYLVRPHPDLGRNGPVCPFARRSLHSAHFWCGVVDEHADLTDAALDDIIADVFDGFSHVIDEHGRADAPAIVTLFPGLDDYEPLVRAHHRNKSTFVSNGFMLGEFYPGCPQIGLWSAEFSALQAPIPMLVARPMASSDFPFLVGNPTWLESYFAQFAPGLPVKLRETMATLLAQRYDDSTAITSMRMHQVGEYTL